MEFANANKVYRKPRAAQLSLLLNRSANPCPIGYASERIVPLQSAAVTKCPRNWLSHTLYPPC
jgi:hypothetical protein